MTTTLQGFGQFLSALPHQFGFVPGGSVILGAMQDNHVLALARLDDDFPGLSGVDGFEALRPLLERGMARSVPDSFVIVEYRAEIGLFDIEAMAEWIEREYLPVQHALTVCGDIWWASRCTTGCCDGALHELTDFHPNREQERAGLMAQPAASRQAAEASLRERDDARAADVARYRIDVRSLNAEACLTQWKRLLKGAGPEAEPLAIVLAACGDRSLRDCLLCAVAPEMSHAAQGRTAARRGKSSERERRLADAAPEALLRTLPAVSGTGRAYWLALLALARWRCGNQTGAGLAAEAALEEGPSTPLARLVGSIMAHGMPYPWGPTQARWAEAAAS